MSTSKAFYLVSIITYKRIENLVKLKMIEPRQQEGNDD